jgi:nitrogenase subunit NifH
VTHLCAKSPFTERAAIGKSTLSANLSAALALSGKEYSRSLDPKHDSTRLLLHGKGSQPYWTICASQSADYRSRTFCRGLRGVGSWSRGPKPGVGCRGRGIISTFELLDQFKLKAAMNVTVYTCWATGCGASPCRSGGSTSIPSSSSRPGVLALYAANNIQRGIRN